MTNRPAPSLAISVRILIGMIALLLAQIDAPYVVCAQDPADVSGDDPLFTEGYGGVLDVGTTPLRIWLQTGGYGQEDGQISIGTRQATQTDSGVAFFDAQYNLKTSKTFGVNVGGGVRSFYETSLHPGNIRILGASVWYDGDETEAMNYFNQFGFSLESLGVDWDFRANANIPFGTKIQQADDVSISNTAVYSGNFLARRAFIQTDFAVEVIDFEVARRLGCANAWIYGGGYNLDGQEQSGSGYTVGVRGYVNDDLLVNISFSDDEVFNTSVLVGVVLSPGRSQGVLGCPQTLTDRLRDPVMRNNYIATRQELVETAVALTNADGNAIRVVHVDSTEMAPGGGDGTFEAPFVSLDDVFGASVLGDIVLLHSGSTHAVQALSVRDEQRALGEGLFRTHSMVTTELGTINLPETAPGALGGPIPVIGTAPGNAITLVTSSVSVSMFDAIEVSNLSINGGARGIVSPTGVGAVNINRMAIEDTTGSGIELTPLVETLADGTTQVRFNTTIDDVTLMRVGGNGIDLDATTAAPVGTPVVEAIAISDVTSTDGGGRAIRINDNKSAATITDFTADGGATSAGGLLLTEAKEAFTITRAAIMNGAGPGIDIRTTDEMFTITETTLTDTGGASLLVDGGASTVDFTGFIDQGGAGSAFAASGGHTGTVTFNEETTGAGVISATGGDGLQFDNGDGVYTFNHRVTLAGGDAGIDFLNDSAAVVTLPDAIITSPTGAAVRAVGGTASLTFTGLITQGNSASVLDVNSGHTGTFIFNEFTAGTGVINATDGDGLQFNGANGAYTFNHEVVLNGGDAGIDIIGGSTGTFTISDLDLTNPSGTALNINGSAAIATISGSITNSAGNSVMISGNTAGSVTVDASITDTGTGIGVANNTGGTFAFSELVDLMTGASDAVTILNNTGMNTTFFGGLTIETTSGSGLAVGNSSTVAVTGTANTIQSTTGIALSVNNSEVGSGGLNVRSVSADGAVTGIDLVNVTGSQISIGASGAAAGDGGTIKNTTDAGIRIGNVANVSINRMVVDTTATDGIRMTHNDNNSSTVSVSNSAIRNTTRVGVILNSSGPGLLTLTLDDNAVDNTGDEGMRLNVGGSADTANIRLTDNIVVNSSNDEALLLFGSGNSAKTINLLATGNQFTNDDPGVAAADFRVSGAVNLNATVNNNVFVNNDAVSGRPFEMSANAPGANVRLNINNNISTSAVPAGDDYFLIQSSGSFSVVDLATIGANNTGTFSLTGTITDDPGPVPTP